MAQKIGEWLKDKSKTSTVVGVEQKQALTSIVVPHEQADCSLQSLHAA